MNFRDHFSRQSEGYSRYRPRYPSALFDYLVSQTARRERAWDCATGSGQTAVQLACYFDDVLATDASPQQIAHAVAHPKVRYSVVSAEDSGLASATVDLITVAQALHWFDLPAFYVEVKRVLRPDGLLAAWSYALLRVTPAVDGVLDRFHDEILTPFWPPERRFVGGGHRDLPFPFAEMHAPCFDMQASWNLHHLLGYLSTWSAVQRYRNLNNSDPLERILDDLAKAWGPAERIREIHWPLCLRVGRP